MSPLLQVEQLSAGYGDAVVLNDVSLSLGEGETLALCAEQYFAQSEQTPTRVRLAVSQTEGGARAGGVLIQYIADDEARVGQQGSAERGCAQLLEHVTAVGGFLDEIVEHCVGPPPKLMFFRAPEWFRAGVVGRNFLKDADVRKHPTRIEVCPELLSDKSDLLHGIIGIAIAKASLLRLV